VVATVHRIPAFNMTLWIHVFFILVRMDDQYEKN
jgi:hypothetical protein